MTTTNTGAPMTTAAQRKAAAKAAGDTPVGPLTDDERDTLLAELDEQEAIATGVAAPAPPTPRDRLLASMFLDRHHLEGCPVYSRELGANDLEAYDQPAPAPTRTLRDAGVRPGEYATIVRCLHCGGSISKPGKVRDVLRAAIVAASAVDELDDAGI